MSGPLVKEMSGAPGRAPVGATTAPMCKGRAVQRRHRHGRAHEIALSRLTAPEAASILDHPYTHEPHRGGRTMAKMSMEEIFAGLREIDTPTITNVVATYPTNPLCLGLYNPWTENWYTDTSIRCIYPEMKPVA